MAETDRGWCLEGAVKPLPISLPFPTWIKNMQAVSLQLPRHCKQAVYTLLPSAPEPASWAGTGAERLKTLCTHHCTLPLFGHCLCLPLGGDGDTQDYAHAHPILSQR